MDVVTFSGVTSGGMVTSGTTCWTCPGATDQLKLEYVPESSSGELERSD